MKKFKYFALALIAVLTMVSFTACGDDDKEKDEPNTPDNASLVGTWKMTKAEEGGDDNIWSSDMPVEWRFESNGNLTIYFKKGTKDEEDLGCVYKVNGNELTVYPDTPNPEVYINEIWNGTFTINGNKMVFYNRITFSDDPNAYENVVFHFEKK